MYSAPVQRAPGPEPPTLIADTALAVVAESGSRALTHRAVDERARLPLGTTSRHHRTRAALLEAAANRLFDLDSHDALEVAAESTDPRDGVERLLARWTSPSFAPRLAARWELALDASRVPTTRTLMRDHRERFLRLVEHALRGAGIPDAAQAAALMAATFDGLLLDHLIGTRRAAHEIRAIIDRQFGVLSRQPARPTA